MASNIAIRKLYGKTHWRRNQPDIATMMIPVTIAMNTMIKAFSGCSSNEDASRVPIRYNDSFRSCIESMRQKEGDRVLVGSRRSCKQPSANATPSESD